MKSLDNYSFIIAMCLSALAGYVDAVGFMQLGGYFVSFMSGNSTRLAVSVIQSDKPHMLLIISIIGFFVVGSMLGTLIHHILNRHRQFFLLLSVSGLLFIASALDEYGFGHIAIVCMTMAMGMENITFQRDDNITVGLTYMTGTLVKLGQYLALALLGIEERNWKSYLLLWAALVSGGVAGAACFSFMGMHSVWLAAIMAGVLAVMADKPWAASAANGS